MSLSPTAISRTAPTATATHLCWRTARRRSTSSRKGTTTRNTCSFEAFRISCDASIADKIVEGAQVTVTAQIQHFYKEAKPEEGKDELEVIEAVNGTVVVAGTGVEEVYTTVPASKFIYDGQLYIIRGNALYNVQGQLVK